MKKKANNSNEELIEYIEEIFNKYNISAIIKIPENPVFSFFNNDGDKLEILEQAIIEEKIRNKILEKDAECFVNENIDRYLKRGWESPNYIG